ncbi:MAG: type VI secretion system baseplate subunit TssE [Chromatiaceae bacterium]|nr:type VI secretion system baseplate subunit TssE [Chromatiaceae bacterium]
MAELSLQERLQPSLLDRLRDDHPEEQSVDKVNSRVLTLSQLRQSVQRDIAWLLNACNLEREVKGYSEVEKSTINYGIPDLAGFTVSSLDVGVLEKTIEQALENFEPRLLKNSIRLRAELDAEKMSHNTLLIDIECDLWAFPAPIELLLRTELDFESGEVSVTEVARRSR